KALHKQRSKVLVRDYVVKSLETSSLHLSQRRTIVIKYNSDQTKIFVTLKSYFGYSFHLSLLSFIKKYSSLCLLSIGTSILTRGSTLFAYLIICLFIFICSVECLSF